MAERTWSIAGTDNMRDTNTELTLIGRIVIVNSGVIGDVEKIESPFLGHLQGTQR